jgi:pyruvate/2-oxoglutarate dehydrogenase complex dihydrolipoamide dehydrogenase (E3) component
MELLFLEALLNSPLLKELKVKGEHNCIIQAEKIIIATGSEPSRRSHFSL